MIVAPISWDLYSATKRYPDKDDHGEQYIPSAQLLKAIQRSQNRYPRVHSADSGLGKPRIGPRNIVPLGIETLVLTTDNYALLRFKDPTTTVGAGAWDVSFSGYARFDKDWCVDPVEGDNDGIYPINIERWLSMEFSRETGAEERALTSEAVANGSRGVKVCVWEPCGPTTSKRPLERR